VNLFRRLPVHCTVQKLHVLCTMKNDKMIEICTKELKELRRGLRGESFDATRNV